MRCCIVLKGFAQALSHFCCVCILMLIMPPNALTPPSMCKKRDMCSNSSLPPCAPHVHNCATTNRCNLCPPAFLSSQKRSGICRNIWQLHGAAPDFSTSVQWCIISRNTNKTAWKDELMMMVSLCNIEKFSCTQNHSFQQEKNILIIIHLNFCSGSPRGTKSR